MKFVLFLHVAGALLTIGTMLYTVLRIPRSNEQFGDRIAILIAEGIFQIVTGILLVAVSPTLNLPAFCVKGLLYLASLGGFIAFLRHKQARLAQ